MSQTHENYDALDREALIALLIEKDAKIEEMVDAIKKAETILYNSY